MVHEVAIGELGLGDGSQPDWQIGRFEERVDRVVDSRYEEACDARDRRGLRRIGTHERFDSSNMGLDHLAVAGQAEDQCHVDADAIADHRRNRVESGIRCGNLDHHVRTGNATGEFTSRGNRSLRIVAQ